MNVNRCLLSLLLLLLALPGAALSQSNVESRVQNLELITKVLEL